MKEKWYRVGMLALCLVLTTVLVADFGLAQDSPPQPLGGGGPVLAGNAFTYQGYLTDGGSPANGPYDFSLGLYADAAGTQWVANVATVNDHPVVDGLFTIPVDATDVSFGDVYFYLNGDARWLKIGVRPGASTGAFTFLSPLQPLTPAPYALALPGMNTVQNATSANVLGGYSWNYATPGIVGATIGGGGYNGGRNEVQASYATVSGGAINIASGLYATVSGGQGNTAAGDYSLAAGRTANAAHSGSLVWADGTGVALASTKENQVRVRATNGAELIANNASYGSRTENTGSGDGIRAIAHSSGTNSFGALYAYNLGDSPAVIANTSSGTYSGYFYDDISVEGNCTGCTLVYVGLNDGAEPLETGDLVAISGLDSPLAGSTDPLLRVHRADASLGEAVVGVVQDRAVLIESERDGERTQSVNRAPGATISAAQPGDYLFIVVQGIAQVKADAAGGAIEAGQRLTAAETPGHARVLATRTIDGMLVAEGAATVGVALGPLDAGTGLIPVMVSLR